MMSSILDQNHDSDVYNVSLSPYFDVAPMILILRVVCQLSAIPMAESSVGGGNVQLKTRSYSISRCVVPTSPHWHPFHTWWFHGDSPAALNIALSVRSEVINSLDRAKVYFYMTHLSPRTRNQASRVCSFIRHCGV